MTREQIEEWRIAWANDGLKPEVFAQLNELCDLALAALSAGGKSINFVIGEPSEDEARRAAEVIAESKALLKRSRMEK